MVDFDSPIPYYIQVKDVIRGQIRDGTWSTGDRLPSEAELCEMFSVSRTVIRQALQDLIHEGLIKRRKGKGSFVAPQKINEQLVQKLTGFYQDMVEQGLNPVTKVLQQQVIPASPTVANYLSLRPGTPVTEIVRLRSVENVPIMLVTTYVPVAYCPHLVDDDLSNQSLYTLLEDQYHLYIARGRRTIQAVAAKGQGAKLLDIPKGAPMFRLDSISYLPDGTPIEYYFAYHRGDRTQFEVELVRTREPNAFAGQLGDLPPSNHFSPDTP
ncbi:MAG: GntR family transcriptional regulator [Anaerolineaceae bacterium]|nr:GntR family transcriptional regulator [Anaerolineaceae bacterium]